MTNEEAKGLIAKYNAGQCTDAEKALLDDWYKQLDHPRPLYGNQKLALSIKAIAAIAAVIFLWFATEQFLKKNTNVPEQSLANEIQPGGNKATLKLANGKTIILSNAKTGVIIDVNELKYSDGTPVENPELTAGVQTLSTPRGGQYQVILKDGTRIWLNAASTLTFNTESSNRPAREVTLSGEAYFEIAKDKTRPFKVHTKNQVIEVLGTHFNVSSYSDESYIETTLLEGSVKVSRSGPHNDAVVLKPGEQSTLVDSRIAVQKVDTDNAIAWKAGEFMFRNEDLKTIMPELARWYDVEVFYQNQSLANRRFGGTISKFENIEEVLKMMELTGEVHFKVEGRRSIVMP
jgi:hypothetical protein